jgi:hypothetical protein
MDCLASKCSTVIPSIGMKHKVGVRDDTDFLAFGFHFSRGESHLILDLPYKYIRTLLILQGSTPLDGLV